MCSLASQISQLLLSFWYKITSISYTEPFYCFSNLPADNLLVFTVVAFANVFFPIPPICLLMTLVLGLGLEAMEGGSKWLPLDKLYFFQGMIITWEAKSSQDIVELVLCSWLVLQMSTPLQLNSFLLMMHHLLHISYMVKKNKWELCITFILI